MQGQLAEFWISFVPDDPRQRERIVAAAWQSFSRDATLYGPVPDLDDLLKPPPSPTDEPPMPALSADGDRASLALDGCSPPPRPTTG